jgi:hypothetical protein
MKRGVPPCGPQEGRGERGPVTPVSEVLPLVLLVALCLPTAAGPGPTALPRLRAPGMPSCPNPPRAPAPLVPDVDRVRTRAGPISGMPWGPSIPCLSPTPALAPIPIPMPVPVPAVEGTPGGVGDKGGAANTGAGGAAPQSALAAPPALVEGPSSGGGLYPPSPPLSQSVPPCPFTRPP